LSRAEPRLDFSDHPPMRIDSSLPLHIARAYGVMPTKHAAPTAQPGAIAPTQPTEKVAAQEPAENVRQLIAGRVRGPVDFASASTPTSPAGAYQLYTRAADKIEAAIAVRTGQAIDVKG
jgi:hypothetical protein